MKDDSSTDGQQRDHQAGLNPKSLCHENFFKLYVLLKAIHPLYEYIKPGGPHGAF